MSTNNQESKSWELCFAVAGISNEKADELFEHLLAAVDEFDSEVCQNTAGSIHRLGESSEVPAS